MAGDQVAATARLRAAALGYRASWEAAPPRSYGRLIGMLKAAVLAIVVEAVIRIGNRALKNRALIALAAAAFIGIFFFAVPFPVIIVAATLLGFANHFYLAAPPREDDSPVAATQHREESLLGDGVLEHSRATVGRTLGVATMWLSLWLIPVGALVVALGTDNVFSQIAIFFSNWRW